MSELERKLFDTLRELVEQIESGNGRDDHGHPLKNALDAWEANYAQ
jgi:hypothetical protein